MRSGADLYQWAAWAAWTADIRAELLHIMCTVYRILKYHLPFPSYSPNILPVLLGKICTKFKTVKVYFIDLAKVEVFSQTYNTYSFLPAARLHDTVVRTIFSSARLSYIILGNRCTVCRLDECHTPCVTHSLQVDVYHLNTVLRLVQKGLHFFF